MSATEANAIAVLTQYLNQPPWLRTQLQAVADASPHMHPGLLNQDLVRADGALNLAYWAVLALVSPFAFPKESRGFAAYYQELKKVLTDDFAVPAEEIRAPAKTIARYLVAEESSYATERRSKVPRETKLDLLDACGRRPYCWYCGLGFSSAAVAQFTGNQGESDSSLKGALYVDFTTKHGLSPRDSRIEVDHAFPHSRGGSLELDNLRLSCGWCNRHKSALSILFDAQSWTPRLRHPILGDVLVPQPFWVVRTLGTTRSCDAPGCSASLDRTQLFVAPSRPKGAMVPGNLGVYCEPHDPLESHRYVPRRTLAR